MKHFLLLLLFALMAYSLWHATKPRDRRKATRFAMPHLLRFGLIVLALLLCLYLAVFLPSTSLI